MNKINDAETLDGQRLQIAPIPYNVLPQVIKGKLIIGGFPEDVEVVSIIDSFECNALLVKLRHDSFDIVADGQRAPFINTHFSERLGNVES